MPTRIRKIVFAPLLESMFTETGYETIDWTAISQKVESTLQETGGDDFEQGQWVEINQVIRPEKLAVDIQSLRRELSLEIESGVNWEASRQFCFLISALSPPEPPAESNCDVEPDAEAAVVENPEDYGTLGTAKEHGTNFPQLVKREVVALIQARNSVVAAWLWRRYAMENRLALNDIRLDWWSGVIGFEAARS